MKSLSLSVSRFLAGLAAGLLIALVVAGIAGKAFRRGAPSKPPLGLKQGFDFRALRTEKWGGPAIGEKIDLKMFKAADGSGIIPLLGKQPIMLVSINPECGMCSVAQDEMLFVSQKAVPLGVQYYPVCFAPVDSSHNFYDYAKSLRLPKHAFEWQGGASPGSAILDMTVPAHLLVDQEGMVLQVWPGSSAEKDVRKRMASQIIDDTILINETFGLRSPSLSKDQKPNK